MEAPHESRSISARMLGWPGILLTIYTAVYTLGFLFNYVPPEQVYLVPMSWGLIALFLAGYWCAFTHEAVAGVLFFAWFYGASIYGHLAAHTVPSDPELTTFAAFPILVLSMVLMVRAILHAEPEHIDQGHHGGHATFG
ncbi:MAG: hypothetical protein HYV27_06870 [Candidatus Hydrogenedentes bacterium]|nr:hypothetical protein [Candidatus Hydrogenedentota bacterium]